MIRAVIFDMDGLLIDTEPIWREVEMALFRNLGLSLTEEQLLETMGVRVAEVTELWYRRHPWHGPTPAEVAQQIENGVIQHVLADGEPKPGVMEALEMVHARGLPIAIASSSSLRLIDAVVQRLGIGRYIQIMASGDNEPMGKPHPGVYLTTAAQLDVAPEDCVALEDSPNGVLSAKGAGMYCVAIPDPNLAHDPRMGKADLPLPSLLDFTPMVLDTINRELATSTA